MTQKRPESGATLEVGRSYTQHAPTTQHEVAAVYPIPPCFEGRAEVPRKDSHAPPLWEVPRREVRVMREDTLLRVSKRTEDALKIHLCEDTRPGPNEEVYLHTKIHRGPNEVCILKIHRRKCIMLYL